MKAGVELMKDGFDAIKGGINDIKDVLAIENNSISAKGAFSTATKLALVKYAPVSGLV
jgi:hypothetical protein